MLRDISQCRLHPLLVERLKTCSLITGRSSRDILVVVSWGSHCWFWRRWRFRPFLSKSSLRSNIHWALHPPICQSKGCYHKKKVEEEHWQPHRWKREAISEQLCWQIWVTGLRYTIPPKTPVSSHICSNSLGTPPSHMSKQGMLAQKESRRRTLTAPLLKERCD